MINNALTLSENTEWDERASLSVILIYISQCRDVVTILSYSDIEVVYVAGQRVIWWCNAACFNVFVDYASDSGDLIFIHSGRRDWSLVEVPHNCEVATDIIRDQQLSTLIPIEFVDLGFRDLHLKIKSSSLPEHGEKRSAQTFKNIDGSSVLLVSSTFPSDGNAS
jgi:hypothetical protein